MVELVLSEPVIYTIGAGITLLSFIIGIFIGDLLSRGKNLSETMNAYILTKESQDPVAVESSFHPQFQHPDDSTALPEDDVLPEEAGEPEESEEEKLRPYKCARNDCKESFDTPEDWQEHWKQHND